MIVYSLIIHNNTFVFAFVFIFHLTQHEVREYIELKILRDVFISKNSVVENDFFSLTIAVRSDF